MKLRLSTSAAAVLLGSFSGTVSAASLRSASLSSDSASVDVYASEEDTHQGNTTYRRQFKHGASASASASASDDYGYDYDDDDDDCFNFFANMKHNALQNYEGSPDMNAKGYAFCTLCSGSEYESYYKATCNEDTQVTKVYTDMVFSHLHFCTEFGKDGDTCSGPPVINWCGTGGLGVDPKPGYKKECAETDTTTHMATIGMMTGQVVDDPDVPESQSMTASQRIQHIKKYPHQYYFNFHSTSSWAHWHKIDPTNPKGMCRGRIELSPSSSTAVEMERELGDEEK